MKIIESNNRVKCQCGCTFEYDANDVRRGHKMERGIILASLYETSTVRCPICKREHQISCVYKGVC